MEEIEDIHLKPYDIDPLLDFDVMTECTKVGPGNYKM